MKKTEHLTKENFFNEMFSTYPKACKLFCDWIDEYKKLVNWDGLFLNGSPAAKQIKFHDVPYEFQQGIWIRFAEETLNDHFEQPEYFYTGDLEEDIKEVFQSLENLLSIK